MCKKAPNIISFYNNRLAFSKCLGFKLLGLKPSPEEWNIKEEKNGNAQERIPTPLQKDIYLFLF